MSEQLFEEQQRRESENMKETAKKMQKLQLQIEEKEKKIQEIEDAKKRHEYDRGVARLIEVISINSQYIEAHAVV